MPSGLPHITLMGASVQLVGLETNAAARPGDANPNLHQAHFFAAGAYYHHVLLASGTAAIGTRSRSRRSGAPAPWRN